MTCWIIHWVFAAEQMEGHTHTWMCLLTDLCTNAYICSLHMHIFRHSPTSTAFASSSSPAVGTCGAPCQHSPCCLIPASGLVAVGTKGKVSRNSYLVSPRPSVLISVISVSASLRHSGLFQSSFLFKNPSCHRHHITALLFLEMQNRAPFDTEVIY